jgi:hypothetical protein
MQRIVLSVVALAVLGSAALAARPDQVLVIYNADWSQDLADSAPGQDSEELARYYVATRTDPKTGLKPYMLGLYSPAPARPILNQTILAETSDDNKLGLVYNGRGSVDPKDWPLSSSHGDVAVPRALLKSAAAGPQFAVISLLRKELGAAMPRRLVVGLAGPQNRRELLLGAQGGQVRTHPAVRVVGHDEALLVLVDVIALDVKAGSELQVECETAAGRTIRFSGKCPPAPPANEAPQFVDLDKAAKIDVGDSSGVRPALISALEVVAASEASVVHGLKIDAEAAKKIDVASLRLEVAPAGGEGAGELRTLLADGVASGALPVVLWRLDDGTLVVQCDLAAAQGGAVRARLSASGLDGGTDWHKEWQLYDLADFELSRTGHDGKRDDAVFEETIAGPIREFLESTRTDDGTLLKDHILYIVAMHGLPLRVESLYGIERGAVSSTRRGDFGDGSALEQRLRLLYYELPDEKWRPMVVPLGLSRRRAGIPIISHPLRRCLIGPGFNPFMHPLTHNRQARTQVWEQGGLEGLRRLDPPRFSTELRAQQPAGRFLYSATRIDAPAMEIARNQIDGAIYAERYLTSKMGPVYYGTYQEAPATAKMLESLGFDTRKIADPADRALSYVGVFNTRARYRGEPESDVPPAVWHRGFYPGSIGYAIRSYLGWDHRRPPADKVSLFGQVLRAGATITAGSAGGAHDTNITWPDSFVLHHLLLSGYEWGDVALRSCMYLDWTLSLVGDPLYRPDLRDTKPDTTPPKVAAREDITLEARPDFGGKCSVSVEVKLANDDPEMAETRLTLWTGDDRDAAVVGENPRYSANPTAAVRGLEPETTYKVAVELIDPYGNRFDSSKSLGVMEVITPPLRPGAKASQSYANWSGKASLRLEELSLDDAGEIELVFTPASDGEVPTVELGGERILDSRGLRVGGAVATLDKLDGSLRAGKKARVLLRWRALPTTREVYLVGEGGDRKLLGSANSLPWTRGTRLGHILHIRAKGQVGAVSVTGGGRAAESE